MRPYKFSIELDALREQINQEHSLDQKYLKPQYVNIRPIQILMDSFLRETIEDKDIRKEVRLAILSLWVERKLESSYDLTLYQCSAIPQFLDIQEDGSYGERTKRFLDDSQAKVEDRVIPGENEFHTIDNEDSFVPIRLTDI